MFPLCGIYFLAILFLQLTILKSDLSMFPLVEDLPSFLLLRLCTKEVNHHDDIKPNLVAKEMYPRDLIPLGGFSWPSGSSRPTTGRSPRQFG